jgi:uncharacterized membrane protein required for colicin V production
VNALDYVLLGILAIFLISGYRRGFLWQALSIATIAVAFFVAARYHGHVAAMSFLEKVRSSSPTAASVGAFIGIFFLITFVAGFILTRIMKRIEEATDPELRQFNRFLGALLGGAKGALLLGGLAVAILQWGLPEGTVFDKDLKAKGEGLVASSYLVPKLAKSCIILLDYIPREKVVEVVEEGQEILHLKGKEEGQPAAAPPGSGASSAGGGLKPMSLDETTTKTAASGSARADAALEELARQARGADKPGRPLDLGVLGRNLMEQGSEGQPVPSSGKTDEVGSPK